MQTVVEIDPNLPALVQLINAELGQFGVKATSENVHVEMYCTEHRIGWNTHIVTIDGWGVYGFTDGPVT